MHIIRHLVVLKDIVWAGNIRQNPVSSSDKPDQGIYIVCLYYTVNDVVPVMHRSHSTFIHVALSSGHCFVAYRENEHSLLNRSRIYYAKLILCASTIKVMLNCYQAISVVPYKTTSPASICLYTVRAPVFPEFADKTCLYRKFFNICI